MGNPNHDPKNGEFTFAPGNKHANAVTAAKAVESQGFKATVYSNPKSNYIAAYSDGNVAINEANRFWKDPAAGAEKAFKTGELSSGDVMHVVNHEIGHAMYAPPDNFQNVIVEQDLARRHVSKYAAMNPKEFVSEVHAGMKAGKQYPDEVMGAFKRYATPRNDPNSANHSATKELPPHITKLFKRP